MGFELVEGDDGAGNGGGPHEGEECPAPESLVAHGHEGDGRVGAGDVPVDGGMVPAAQPLLPLVLGAEGVIDGGGDIAAEHAEEIEGHAEGCPAVLVARRPDDEQRAYDHGEEDAGGMAP